MSDENSQPSTPSDKPTDKTSSVPLKKETVRVTIKAQEGSAPPAPAAGAPPAPKPPAAPAQATQPLKPTPPAQAAGAKTVPLSPAPAAATPESQSAPPQATIKLQPSQPGASAPGGTVAPISTGRLSASLDDAGEESGVTLCAALCLVLAIVVCAIELASSPMLSQQDNSGKPGYGIPHDDYDRKYDPGKDNEGNIDNSTIRFTRVDDSGVNPPKNQFTTGLPSGLPVTEYDAFVNEN